MQKRLPYAILLMLVLTQAGLAQTHLLTTRLNYSADATIPVRLDATPEHARSAWLGAELGPAPIAIPVRHSAAKLAPVVFDKGTRPAAPRGTRSSVGRLFDSVTVQDTPFTEHVSLPMLASLGGRLAVNGFYSLSPMENVLMGLPGSGSLPAWGVSGYSHLVVSAPQHNAALGLSFSMRLGRSRDGASNSFLKCLGGLFGRGGRS